MKIPRQNELLLFCALITLGRFGTDMVRARQSDATHKCSGASAVRDSRNSADTAKSLSALRKPKRSKPPNILLIGVETLRADHVGCFGYHRNTTPTLDKLAKEGVLFSRAIATSSWTIPTCMSVFTSLYPGVHKTTDHRKRLSEGKTTLAEILREDGYLTSGFVSTTHLDRHNGFSKGFDFYDDFSIHLAYSVDVFGCGVTTTEGIYNVLTSEVVNRTAIAWLQKNYEEPFFMFVFYYDPHFDYIPPPPFDTVFDPNYDGSIDGYGINSEPRKSTRPQQRDLDHIIALYDGEILYTDGYVSKLLEKFEEYGILDRTLVIVFGDHGDEFYEHGSTAHAHSLYNELIHIPLIFWWPRVISQDRRVNAIVSQVDIMPTILDYLNIEHDGFVQGSSLKPLIEGREDKLHDVVYAELNMDKHQVLSAAISEQAKFILDVNTGKKQLFDLNNDPREQINICKRESSAGPIPLESNLKEWMSNNERVAGRLYGNEGLNKVELDENRLRELRSLGYTR